MICVSFNIIWVREKKINVVILALRCQCWHIFQNWLESRKIHLQNFFSFFFFNPVSRIRAWTSIFIRNNNFRGFQYFFNFHHSNLYDDVCITTYTQFLMTYDCSDLQIPIFERCGRIMNHGFFHTLKAYKNINVILEV